LSNCLLKVGVRKAIAKELIISRWTLYKLLFNIRKTIGAQSTLEMLNILRPIPEQTAPTTLRFSPRGREVFMLIMEGLNIKKISERLGMSISGVKRHREKMLLQNGCTNMLELIAKYHGMQDGEGG